jgi:MOSC domain-containing protein YiiM
MDFKSLFDHFAQPGMVTWIGIRPTRRAPMDILSEVFAVAGKGLEGDRYSGGGKRQLTLIQEEHLAAIGSILGGNTIDASITRRNIVIRGINLLSLKGKTFKIGEAIVEYTGECHPCSRMEEALGKGGYNAMRGHGGITARIVKSGKIRIGDAVTRLPD